MSWIIQPGAALLERHADAWQQMQRRYYGCHPLFDIRFVGPALRYFGEVEDGVRLAVKIESGEPVMMGLVEDRGLGRWQLFLPSQIPLGPLLLRTDISGEDCAVSLDDLLAALPRYAWTIGLPKLDPAYCAPLNSCAELQGERRSYATTVNIAIEGSFEIYWQSRSKNLRAKMRRLAGRFEEQGGHLHEVRETSRMGEAVAEHGRLESAGWKGLKGTAIHKDNIQGLFYRDLLERFAAAGGARVFQLQLGGRVIASQIAVQENGILVLLKTAHDESFAAYSPGRLLDYLMLQRLFTEQELRVVEYYTSASAEDARWSTAQREIYHFNYFRSRLFKGAAVAARKVRHVVPNWSVVPPLHDCMTTIGIQ